MDAKKRLNKIFTAVNERVKEEIGILLGVEFALSDTKNVLVSKEDFFESLVGRQILTKVDLVGDLEGAGCLVLGIKDAIRLGGTLIMLPSSELEEVVGREEYTEETEDSYGEIANIIAGSYTKVFEEMYPKSCRFIRKEQEILVPTKVETASELPIPDRQYFQVSCSMSMEGMQMGDIHMLVPADLFGFKADQAATTSEQSPQARDTVSPSREDEKQPVKKPPVEAPAAETPQKPEEEKKKKPSDPAKHLKRIEKILTACEKKLTGEVTSLLGAEVKFTGLNNRLVSKEEFFFDELEGKQVMADLEVAGDLQGKSQFFVCLKDAIHLGGVLIMLPPSELENVVAEEEFGEDAKDAYGEVANIIAGVYTSVFEEQYPERIRFIKKGIRQIVPMKVEIDSDDPVSDQQYYLSSMSMQVDGVPLGKVRMLFPAALLSIETPDQASETKETETADTVSRKQPEQMTETAASPTVPGDSGRRNQGFDVEKHRKRIDRLLKECQKRMQTEVGALIDAEISLEEMENRLISKEDFFFEVASGKQMMVKMDVLGELQDKSYLFFSLKDAVRLGGLLVMLPPTELETVVAEEKVNEDTLDAFGEIANIISGVYSGVFEEQYTRKIRFVKADLEQVVPMRVDADSDVPIPNQQYYLSSMSLSIEGSRLGRINVLFPAGLLQLEGSAEAEAVLEQVQVEKAAEHDSIPAQAAKGEAQSSAGRGASIDVLLISDDENVAAGIASCAEAKGYSVRKVSFKDNLKAAISSDLKAVYIIMRDVNEQAFGIAIKVSSSCSLPVVAAGPDWTRSKVIKAVKYGINDILLTPATPEDIRENLENNLVRMAA